MFECVDKEKVREFFDRLAPGWDEQLIVYPEKVERILDAARIGAGSVVLDVACGTGTMIGPYLQRESAHVTAVDFSERMVQICSSKYAGDPRVDVLCADAESCELPHCYDAVMIFNAFPHFPDPQAVVEHLGAFVKPGGTFTVAHDLGRKKLDEHHSGVASEVSHGMMHEDDVAALFSPEFTVGIKVSEPDIFIVTAMREPVAGTRGA